MPTKKTSEMTAGLFVIAGLVVLLGVVLWLGAADVLKTRGQRVTFYLPMSQGSLGLEKGAAITCGDGRVGRLIQIEPVPAKRLCYYRVQLERNDITLKRDAVAVLVSPPVGQAKIVIKSFGKAAEDADDANPVCLTGGLDQFMGYLNGLADDLEDISAMVRGQLDPGAAESLVARVHEIVRELRNAAVDVGKIAANVRTETDAANAASLAARIHQIAASLAHQTDPNRADALLARVNRTVGHVEEQVDPNRPGSLMDKVRGTVDEVHGTIRDSRPNVKETVASVRRTAERIEGYANKELADVFKAVQEVKVAVLEAVGHVGGFAAEAEKALVLNRPNIDKTLDNLRQVSATLKAAGAEIRRSPWKILYEPKKEDLEKQVLYDTVRAFVSGAEHLDQAIAKLKALQQLKDDHPGIEAATEDIRKHLLNSFQEFKKVEDQFTERMEKAK